MRVGWAYVATVTYQDDSEKSVHIRFPSPGWWLITASGLLSSPALRKGRPLRLKDGTRAWVRPDGALEFREPWHE
jgi:hypothetical protein